MFYIVYLDNILIYSDSPKEYLRYLYVVLNRLRKFVLYTNLKKCTFFTTKVEFLGYIVSVVGVAIDPCRVSTIED